MKKKIRRRKLYGTPLLIASAGAFALISGCNSNKPEPVTGNLVPPPQTQLCVEVMPPDATVVFNGQTIEGEKRCADVFEGNVTVKITAAGHIPFEEDITVLEPTTRAIVLKPAIEERPPVGNLMPPQPVKPDPQPDGEGG